MAKHDDGGQAFPMPAIVDGDTLLVPSEPGMTLHDWFAGMAMTALLARSDLNMMFTLACGTPQFNGYNVGPRGEEHIPGESVLARLASQAADAMIAEKRRKEAEDG